MTIACRESHGEVAVLIMEICSLYIETKCILMRIVSRCPSCVSALYILEANSSSNCKC